MDAFIQRKETLIVANGERPSRSLFDYHHQRAKTLIALDGAALWLEEEWALIPNLVIGDFDSVPFDRLKHLERLRIEEQNSNDLEKALHYCLQHHLAEITVLGAFGMRCDHFLTNVMAMRRFASKLMVTLVDATQCAFFCPTTRKLSISHSVDSFFSLFPFGEKIGPIWTTGVLYPLEGEFLSMRSRLGTLNSIVDNAASVICHDGDLLMVIENKFSKNL